MPGYRKETGYGRCWCERERRGKEMRRWEQVFILELGFEKALYTLICRSNGPQFSDLIQRWEIIGPHRASLC